MNPTPLDEHAGAHLDAIRQSYDTVAADYARFVKDPGALDPVSRAVLSAFAELVVSSGLGPTADGEFHRALAPGGHLLLVTRVGEEEHQRRTYGYGDGDPAPFDSYRLPAGRIAELLERAGFAITAQTLQTPEEGAKRPVASFLARKPAVDNVP